MLEKNEGVALQSLPARFLLLMGPRFAQQLGRSMKTFSAPLLLPAVQKVKTRKRGSVKMSSGGAQFLGNLYHPTGWNTSQDVSRSLRRCSRKK